MYVCLIHDLYTLREEMIDIYTGREIPRISEDLAFLLYGFGLGQEWRQFREIPLFGVTHDTQFPEQRRPIRQVSGTQDRISGGEGTGHALPNPFAATAVPLGPTRDFSQPIERALKRRNHQRAAIDLHALERARNAAGFKMPGLFEHIQRIYQHKTRKQGSGIRHKHCAGELGKRVMPASGINHVMRRLWTTVIAHNRMSGTAPGQKIRNRPLARVPEPQISNKNCPLFFPHDALLLPHRAWEASSRF